MEISAVRFSSDFGVVYSVWLCLCVVVSVCGYAYVMSLCVVISVQLGKKKKVEQAAQLASSNLNHYAAILHAAAYLPGVTRLLQPVSCSNQFCR